MAASFFSRGEWRTQGAVAKHGVTILRAVREDIRTLWVTKDPELIKIVSGIRELEIRLGIQSSDEPRRSRRAA